MLDLLCAPYAATIHGAANQFVNAANVLNERLGRVATFAAGGLGGFIEFDLGAAKPVDVIGVLATSMNYDSPMQMSIQGSNSSSWATTPFDSGPMFAMASVEANKRIHRNGIYKLPTVQTYRYWRVQLVKPTAGEVQTVGRIVIGKAFEPLEGRDYGWEQRVIDLGENRRSATGLDDPVIRGKVQHFSWAWSGLTKDEAENQVLDLIAYAGTTRDLLFCADYTAANRHNLIGYGKLVDAAPVANYAEGWYEMQCQLQSRLILSL